MNIKLVLILHGIAFKFVYFISDQFRSVKRFSREVSRQETAVSSANCEFSDVIAVRSTSENA
jgi:hypothetical protein